MTADQTPDGAQDAEAPARTLEDAVRELRGLRGQLAARDRKGRDTRTLERLQRQAARWRGAQDAATAPQEHRP